MFVIQNLQVQTLPNPWVCAQGDCVRMSVHCVWPSRNYVIIYHLQLLHSRIYISCYAIRIDKWSSIKYKTLRLWTELIIKMVWLIIDGKLCLTIKRSEWNCVDFQIKLILHWNKSVDSVIPIFIICHRNVQVKVIVQLMMINVKRE